MKDAWDALAGFESRDLISSFFKKRHGIEPNAGKVREIASSFAQGREYFTSAAQSNISVKPLLLYYGVLALSRALILALSPNLRENALKPSHGLEVRNWQEALTAKDFASLEVRILNGTFSELLAGVKNRSYFRFNQSSVNWGMSFPPLQEGQIFTFFELASGFPDMDREILAWSQGSYNYARVSEITRSQKEGMHLDIGVYHRGEPIQEIESLLPAHRFPGKNYWLHLFCRRHLRPFLC